MKKALSLLAVLAALAGSASAASYVLPYNQPGALTPVDCQPTYNVEALYAIGEHDMPDTFGVRGSFSLYNTGEGAVRHQFSINIAAEFGNDQIKTPYGSVDQDIWMLPVTAGYDINVGLCDTVFLDIGAKAGWAAGCYEATFEDMKYREEFNGFTMGVGAGLKFICNERLYFKVGYEFNRTFVHNALGTNFNQHVITAGIGTQF